MTRTQRLGPRDGGAGGLRMGAAAAVLTVVLLAVPGTGCNQGPARAALAEADQALAVVRSELERYVPAELARIDADAAEARARLVRGRYTDALRIAQQLPGRVALAAAAAEAKRRELVPAWARLAEAVPPALDGIQARLTELEGARSGPRGPTPTVLDAEKTELAAIRDAWVRAEAAFKDRDVPGAIRLASEAQAKLDALDGQLRAPSGPAPVRVARPPVPAATPGAPVAPTPVEGPAAPPAPGEERPPGMEKR